MPNYSVKQEQVFVFLSCYSVTQLVQMKPRYTSNGRMTGLFVGYEETERNKVQGSRQVFSTQTQIMCSDSFFGSIKVQQGEVQRENPIFDARSISSFFRTHGLYRDLCKTRNTGGTEG